MDFLTGMPPEPKPGSKNHSKAASQSMTESQWVRSHDPMRSLSY